MGLDSFSPDCIKHIVRATALKHHRLSSRIIDNHTVFPNKDDDLSEEDDNVNFLNEDADKTSRIANCLNHDFLIKDPMRPPVLWIADILIKGDYAKENWTRDSSVEVTVIWTLHHSLGDGLSMVLIACINIACSGPWPGHT